MVRHVRHHMRKQAPLKKRMSDKNIFPQVASQLVNNAPQNLLGISDTQLGGMLESAWQLLMVGECPAAVRAFTLLCFVQPYVSDFWYGLGKSLREYSLYEDALSALLMAETLDPSRFEYYEESIGCCIDLGQKKEAERILRRVHAKRRAIEHFSEYAHAFHDLQKQVASMP